MVLTDPAGQAYSRLRVDDSAANNVRYPCAVYCPVGWFQDPSQLCSASCSRDRKVLPG
ncbi:hypothetical protein BH24ACT15_BH24ACT15_08460 [soil metagenome]